MCSKENKCFICNKFYSSYKSWWNHNKQFHKNETVYNNIIDNTINTLDNTINTLDNTLDNTINTLDNINKKYNCSKCNKIFNNYQNRWKHEKICKLKNIQPIPERNELIELKKENEEIKNTISELKNLILQQAKIHPKTLQKINKQLINNNNNSNNTTNTNIINNTYVKFGSVPHSSVLK